jgi:HSP20 family protein
VPSVDVFENEQHELVLKAELPGIKREDIDLKVENNVLTIRGERKRDAEIKQDGFHRVERTYGAFARSFTLPPTVNAEGVKAEFKDGVLTVVLPAREEAKPRQVQIAIN